MSFDMPKDDKFDPAIMAEVAALKAERAALMEVVFYAKKYHDADCAYRDAKLSASPETFDELQNLVLSRGEFVLRYAALRPETRAELEGKK